MKLQRNQNYRFRTWNLKLNINPGIVTIFLWWKLLKKLILLVVVLGLTFPAFVSGVTLGEEKLQLEKSIQQKVETLVEKIIGGKNFVVLVTVEVKIPEQPPASNITHSRNYPGIFLREEEYLPGISYSFLPITNPATNLPMQLVIDKIIVNIAVDTTLQEKIVSRLKTEIPTLIGLNPARGDTVIVNKIEFQKVPTLQLILEQLLPNLYLPFITLIIALFLFGPVTHFFRTIVKAVQLRIDADARFRSSEKSEVTTQASQGLLPGVEPLGLPGRTELSGPAPTATTIKKEPGEKKHFNFINSENIKNLWYLLKDEPPEKIALVMNYLSTDLASEFMTMLDRKTQSAVVLELASVKLPDPEEVQKLEQEIKSKIDYCIGGEEYFLSILDQADKDVQEDILQALSLQNPELAEQLRKKIFLFEDLLYLDKTTLQKIIREIQRRGISLPIVLKTADEEIKNKIMDCLTEGGRAMLAEQIDLLGEIAEKVIKNEQKKVVSTVRELLKSGEIVIDRSKFIKELVEKQRSLTIQPEEMKEG